jgi:multidrug efflux system outer membrane protein
VSGRLSPIAAMLGVVAVLAGCQLSPPTRPDPVVPESWRTPATTARSLGDFAGREIFRSDELDALVREALAANADLAIALQRVELARSQFGIQRSAVFPQVGGTLSYDRGRFPVGNIDENRVSSSSLLGLSLATWEIDLWGRVRAAAEGARRDVLAADELRLATQVSIVAQVATLYLRLLELDLQLDIARRTRETRRESLRLVTLRYKGGVASKLEVQDATTLVAGAEQTIAELSRALARTENALSVLLGRNPGRIARTQTLPEFPMPAELPAGLPSELLLRRPDIRAAEQALAGADANVEAARLAFFPTITLSGLLGFASPALKDLFDSGRYAWQVGPAIGIPIFTAGRLASNLEGAEAQRAILQEQYKQSVRVAFQDVNDALSDFQRYSEERAALATAVDANRERLRLSDLRYKGGVASYFEVLDASRQLFETELRLTQVLGAQYASVIGLYRALGGSYGMQVAPADLPATPLSPRRAGATEWP